MRVRIASKNSTALLAHGFNSRGYRTYWQKYEIYFKSLGVGPRYAYGLKRVTCLYTVRQEPGK
jgi:hypothetical protein